MAKIKTKERLMFITREMCGSKPVTVQELIDKLKEKYDVTIINAIIYDDINAIRRFFPVERSVKKMSDKRQYVEAYRIRSLGGIKNE